MAQKLADVLIEMETATTPGTEEVFKPEKVNAKRNSTSGKMWEVNLGKELISSRHQSIGKQVASDPLEKDLARKTARSWRIALDTAKQLESCLRKKDREVSRKRRNWDTQQRAEVNKLELRSQLRRTWEKLLLEYFENEMRAPSSAQPLMENPFVRTAWQLIFT